MFKDEANTQDPGSDFKCTSLAVLKGVKPRGGGEGAHVKILTGMLVLFFGFEIWPNPIFLGWQIF